MRDPGAELHASRRQRALVAIGGAAAALAAGVYLSISIGDYALNGCDCNQRWYPYWVWIVTTAVAVACYLAAFVLLVRAFGIWRRNTGSSAPPENQN